MLTTEDTEDTERATPETDGAERMAFAQEYMVPTNFARKLERERDEAAEDATNYYARLGEAEKERDELKAELARIQLLLLDPHAVFLNFLHGKIAKLDWDKLEHIHGPHPARVERDEARERLHKVLKVLDDYEQAIKNPSSSFLDAFKKWFTWEAAK